MIAAKRGDLVVIETTHDDSGVPSGGPHVQYEVGRVKSITRAGMVKKYEVPGYSGSMYAMDTTWAERLYHARWWVQPAATVDVEAAIEIARAHVWPAHPESPMPYDSLLQVKAALQGCRKS